MKATIANADPELANARHRHPRRRQNIGRPLSPAGRSSRPFHRPDPPDAGNMLIQGDNLEGSTEGTMLPFYAGQVKCIYIDPPYNTRSAFEHYDDNLEHSKWLATMWPRLELLRDLPIAAEDGSTKSFGRKRRSYQYLHIPSGD